MRSNTVLSRRKRLLQKVIHNPPQLFALGFFIIIAIGTLLLMLPVSTADRHHLTFVDALFEAASAVCVTGLVVADTQTTFTLFGQIVLLSLIQIGGLGFMTLGVFILVLFRRNVGFANRNLIKESLNQYSYRGIVKLVRTAVGFTLISQLAGTLLLGIHWADDFGFPRSLYYGAFHSISAFNNAGFDIMGDFSSMTAYAGDITVTLTLSALIIVGGLGFIVIADMLEHRSIKRLSLHSKLILSITLALNIAAAFALLLLEYHNPATIGGMSLSDKLTASYFHAVVPRTAGFNSLNTADLTLSSQLLTMLLMFIGGGSGGTAGGIKITTAALIVLAVYALIKGNNEVNIWKRRIPGDLIFKGFAITTYSIAIVFLAVFMLSITESGATLQAILFEVVSAFGTVGMSLGLTTELTDPGKMIITLLMFLGRVGPLTVAFALTVRHQEHFKNAEERVIIG